jgi:hypothetical protein
VRQRLEEYAKKVGFGLLIANFSVGNAPREYTERSMRLFAEKVMPKLRSITLTCQLFMAEVRSIKARHARERGHRAPSPFPLPRFRGRGQVFFPLPVGEG